MARVNPNYLKLENRYLFSEIATRTREFSEDHPDALIIKLGIGDTTAPLVPAVIEAFHAAVDDMADPEGYHGYGPYRGYEFLREAIVEHDYQSRGVELDLDEVFVSDGAKCDTGNILDIFGENVIAITDPSYPVYVDTNVMAGNTGPARPNGQYEGLVYLPCTAETHFVPELPDTRVDLIYLCSPNNPTGTTLKRADLERWVAYAREHRAVILFDAAYERYVTESDVPHSIYEIEGAKSVAIEFRSFSKTAGFTGTRCAFTVVPKELEGFDAAGNPHSVHDLWFRRQSTKFNGVSYPVQRAAAAIYTAEGARQVDAQVHGYLKNARLIREGLAAAGFTYFGGVNSPYIWLQAPAGMTSWAFFDLLLSELHVVGTPGSGFGPSGEGYFRLTAFNSHEKTQEAVARIREYAWDTQ